MSSSRHLNEAAYQTRPLHPLFGLEVNLGDPLACRPQDFAELDRLIAIAGLVLMRGVHLRADDLARFAGSLGPLQNLSSNSQGAPGIFRLSNLAEDGSVRPADDVSRLRHEANKLWHADSSFMVPGARYSFLHALVVPDRGKDTLFCDGRVAWEALDAACQATLLPLTATHSMAHSWRLAGVTVPPIEAGEKVSRKLVRWHEPSGRHALVVPSHVEQIVGLSLEESREQIDALTAIASGAERVYRHRWQVGDLLIWDNRCMLHRVSRSGAEDQPRDLLTCRTIDEPDNGLVSEACLPEQTI